MEEGTLLHHTQVKTKFPAIIKSASWFHLMLLFLWKKRTLEWSEIQYKDEAKNKMTVLNTSLMQEMALRGLVSGIEGMSRLLSNIRSLVSTILNITLGLQRKWAM